jgi:hypothetical protein
MKARDLMIKRHIRRLPVVSDGDVAGIVSNVCQGGGSQSVRGFVDLWGRWADFLFTHLTPAASSGFWPLPMRPASDREPVGRVCPVGCFKSHLPGKSG